jgi:CRP-like cAMP-binding protein
MARPFEKLPAGAKNHLESMAANGLLSESAAATALGMPLSEFRRVIGEHKPSTAIWNNALSVERDKLLAALYNRALEGDTKAAQTLLAVRHGMSEKQPQSNSERVSVVFNLPAAMDAAEYMKAVKVEQERLPDCS